MPKGIYKHKRLSEETKRKIGLKHKGIPRPGEVRLKIKETKKLKPYIYSEEVKLKMSQLASRKRPYRVGQLLIKNRGENNINWKGGVSKNKNGYNLKRRAIIANLDTFHTVGEWELLKNQYNWICPCCKRQEPEIKLTEDHIIPLSKGGSNNIENIQPLCQDCNSRKYTKIIKYE